MTALHRITLFETLILEYGNIHIFVNYPRSIPNLGYLDLAGDVLLETRFKHFLLVKETYINLVKSSIALLSTKYLFISHPYIKCEKSKSLDGPEER